MIHTSTALKYVYTLVEDWPVSRRKRSLLQPFGAIG